MDLHNIIAKLLVPKDNYILINFDMFFNRDLNEYYKFSLDDQKEINSIFYLLKIIKKIDESVIFYVLAYSNESVDYRGHKFIYADFLWINTTISAYELNIMFEDFINIKPSSICEYEKMNEFKQKHLYLFDKTGDVTDLLSIYQNYNFENVKILYWD